MTDPLKSRFEAAGREVTPPPGDLGTVQRRGQRRRRLQRFVSGGVAMIVLIAGVAGATTLLGGDGITPAPGPEAERTFARYFFEAVSRDASASGVLEVNSQEGTLCYEATTENIQASRLLRNTGVTAGGRRFVRTVVVGFFNFDPDDPEYGAQLPPGAPICFHEQQLGALENGAHMLIEHPEDFAISFHRGPDDEPGLVAQLEYEERRFGDRGDVLLEDTIEAQGGTIRLRVEPETIGNGKITKVLLVNDSDAPIGYGHAYVLEKQSPTGWEPVKSPNKCGFRDNLMFIAPGDEISHPIGPYDRGCAILPIEPGDYRVTKDVELESGDRVPLTVTFTFAAPRDPSTRKIDGCPVTTPTEPAFVPPAPYPSRFPNPNVPDADDRQWYGTGALWTALDSEGEVWQDLPDEDGDGRFTEKTFWWSHAMDEGPSPITVRGRQIDGPGSFKTRVSGGGGSREDIGQFMLVGIEIPAGCWELTGTFRGAELSYVVLVKDGP